MYLDEKCKVIGVDKNSSSDKQGIQANDVIIKINGEDTNKDTNQVLSILKENQINTFTLTIQRGKEEIKKEITPENVSKYYLGVNMKKAPDNIKNRIIYFSLKEISWSKLKTIILIILYYHYQSI